MLILLRSLPFNGYKLIVKKYEINGNQVKFGAYVPKEILVHREKLIN